AGAIATRQLHPLQAGKRAHLGPDAIAAVLVGRAQTADRRRQRQQRHGQQRQDGHGAEEGRGAHGGGILPQGLRRGGVSGPQQTGFSPDRTARWHIYAARRPPLENDAMSPAFKPLLPLALASLLSTFAAPATAADVTYTLDPSHTQVQFNWAHMGYSHPGGDFDTISGSLKWNAADISKSSVKVNIAVDSIHTRVAALDEELRGDKFFDTAKFPTITFTSTKVER